MKKTVFFLFSFFVFLSAYASPEHDQYSKFFPFHIEYAALTQVKPLNEEPGGLGGHAILYIHGLCKDETVDFPRVIPCSEVQNKTHEGVGISVDKDFRNINWVPVPGYDLFTHGLPSADEKVDQAAIDRVVNESLKLKIFRGVKVNHKLVDPRLPAEEYERRVILSAIATDLAIRYGRDVRAVRIPVPEEKIKVMADYLNEVNRPYLASEKEYAWSGIYNNCAHLSANTLAAAGMRSEIPTGLGFWSQLMNLAIPRNGLATMQEIAHHQKIDFISVLKDQNRWKTVSEDFYLPTGFGGISNFFPVFKNNEIYKTDLKAIHIPQKIALSNIGLFHRSRAAFTDPKFHDLEQSAIYWGQEYSRALSKSDRYEVSPEREKYRAVIQMQLERVRAVLKALKSSST